MKPMVLGLTVVLALAASQAGAQETPTQPLVSKSPAVEVTPFVSLGSQGSSLFGAAVAFPISSNLSVEVETGYRRGEGDVAALDTNVNLLYALPNVGRATPYVTGGAGLAQFGSPIFGRDRTIVGTQQSMKFVVNAGGGVKVAGDDNWDMRTDARWFKSFGRYGSEHWRVAQGVSFDVAKR